MDALQVLANVRKLDILQTADDTINENSEVFADLIATQMAHGVRSDGSDILPSYKPLTIEMKQGRSGLAGVTDRVTLFDQGNFYRGLFVKAIGLDIEYGSRDWKLEKLDKKYSTRRGSIVKPTEESKEEIITGFLQPQFYEKAHAITGL